MKENEVNFIPILNCSFFRRYKVLATTLGQRFTSKTCFRHVDLKYKSKTSKKNS